MSLKFLRYPRPFNYESLSNYIYRLARENYCQESWIYNELKLSTFTRISDFNYEYKDNVLDLISKATQNYIEDIKNMTVHRFSFGSWPVRYGFKASLSYINIVDSNHSKFCPLCLREQYYHRIFWSLYPISVCINHNSYLYTKCSVCGKNVTCKEIIFGKCDCGFSLIESKPIYCNDAIILRSQKRIYKMFRLYDICDHINLDEVISHEFYVSIVQHLKLIMKEYKITDFFGQYKYLPDRLKTFTTQIYAEYLIESWPDNFLNLISFFNKDYFISISNSINPLYIILGLEDIIKKNNFLYNALWIYFQKNYNIHFFRNILKTSIIEGKYISVTIAAKYFQMNYRSIIKNFNIYRLNNIDYVSIEDILYVLLVFVKRGTLFNKEIGYININHYKLKSMPSLTIYDIYKLVIKGNIVVKIDPFKEGFSMIYIKESDIFC